MKTTLASFAASMFAMVGTVVVGTVSGLNDQPTFHFSAGFFVGFVFTKTHHFMEVRRG